MVQKVEQVANYFDANGLGVEAKKLRDLAQEFRTSGVPEDFPPQSPRLEPIRFALEIPAVSEELYNRTHEAVEQAGYNFIVPIRPVSIKDLLAEDSQRELEGKPGRLGYVNNSKAMRATVPPEMEIAINPAGFKIAGSNRLSTDGQKTKIKEEEAKFKAQLLEELRKLVSMPMVDPSTLSQVEDAYMDQTQKLLFPDFFARTDVQTVRGYVASVGRGGPANRRLVGGWDRGGGSGDVFGVSVVVLPRKLAV